MKKAILLLALALMTLLIFAADGSGQKKPDVVGLWVGYAVVGDGSRVELNLVVEKKDGVYTGKLGDTAGMIPESQIRDVVFKDNKLTFEFDFAQGMESILIKIDLTLENDVLKGHWFDPEGSSDIIELTLKK